MKQKSEWINEYVLTPIMGVLFLVTWPIIILWVGIKALFGKNIKNSKRIDILREVGIIILVSSVLFLMYWVFGSIEN